MTTEQLLEKLPSVFQLEEEREDCEHCHHKSTMCFSYHFNLKKEHYNDKELWNAFYTTEGDYGWLAKRQSVGVERRENLNEVLQELYDQLKKEKII